MAYDRTLSKFIPGLYNPDKQIQTGAKLNKVVPLISSGPSDSHQQRSGLIAQSFANAKDHTFHGGFFEP